MTTSNPSPTFTSPLSLLLTSEAVPSEVLDQALESWKAHQWDIDPNGLATDGTPLLIAVLNRFESELDDSKLKIVLSRLHKSGLNPNVKAVDGTPAIEWALGKEMWGAAMLLEAWGAPPAGLPVQQHKAMAELRNALSFTPVFESWFDDLRNPVAGFGSFDASPQGLPLALELWHDRVTTGGFTRLALSSSQNGPLPVLRAVENAERIFKNVLSRDPQSDFALWGWVTMGGLASAYKIFTEGDSSERKLKALERWSLYERRLLKARYGKSLDPVHDLLEDVRVRLLPVLQRLAESPDRRLKDAGMGGLSETYNALFLRLEMNLPPLNPADVWRMFGEGLTGLDFQKAGLADVVMAPVVWSENWEEVNANQAGNPEWPAIVQSHSFSWPLLAAAGGRRFSPNLLELLSKTPPPSPQEEAQMWALVGSNLSSWASDLRGALLNRRLPKPMPSPGLKPRF